MTGLHLIRKPCWAEWSLMVNEPIKIRGFLFESPEHLVDVKFGEVSSRTDCISRIWNSLVAQERV